MCNEMKRTPLISSSLLIFVWLFLCIICSLQTHFVSGQCHDDDKSLLVEFKNNLTFTPDSSYKLRDWNQSMDCCQWSGVECGESDDCQDSYVECNNSTTGRVTALLLYDLNITSDINNCSSLFRLQYLRTLALANNYIQGSIPPSISALKNLEYLDLNHNNLNGSIPDIDWGKLVNLYFVDFSYNKLEGPIPKSIFQLKDLQVLNLSSNRFNGTIKLAQFLQSYKQLDILGLSSNYLSVDTHGCGVNSSFPQLTILDLANCNIHSFPEFLKNQTSLSLLDLSMNQISGILPMWIWGSFNPYSVPSYFNISSNYLVAMEQTPSVNVSDLNRRFLNLDLHSNNLHGTFPILPFNLLNLECSNNHFIAINNGIHLSKAYYLSFSNNNLHGRIPITICNATDLILLNLELNHLNGMIPNCLISMKKLVVLSLRGNNLEGPIPAKLVGQDCRLKTLNLNRNFLQGRVPRSLANCKALKVLDLGNNQINDTFPCHLKSLPNLQVLILRSNKFHGTLVCPQNHSIWPRLQILDLASNYFYGELIAHFLFKWTSMMGGTRKEAAKLLSHLDLYGGYYQNSVAVTFKGNTYELQYILSIFSSIDFSNNLFHGELPEELGNLNGLIVLNVSHNSFSGKIPPTIGNLTQIQSLDLSCNAFSGRIPPQLANLNFLEYLNLSYNKLSGRIPTSTQLQSFNASSYVGNQGLYGPPLTPFNRHEVDPRTNSSSQGSDWSSKSAFEWMLMGAGVGFPVGITVILGPLLYIKRYREWYCNFLHVLVMKILRKDGHHARGRRRVRQPNRQQRRRR